MTRSSLLARARLPLAAVALAALAVFACSRWTADKPEVNEPEAKEGAVPPAPPSPRVVEGTLAITNVTVIDVVAGVARPNMTVVVRGERIVAVEPAGAVRVADEKVAVDGTGGFLIPGLWDMHAHVVEEGSSADFLRHGVTGVRHMFSLMPYVPDSKPADANGPPRPRFVAAAYMLDGTSSRIPFPFNRRVLQADTADDARKQVRALKELGNAFVKVQSRLPPDAYFAAVAEAKALGLTVAGHLPYGVTAAQASDAGQHTIEHLGGVAAMCSPIEKRCVGRLVDSITDPNADPHINWKVQLEAFEAYDPKLAAVGLRKFVENGTWHVPTLAQTRGLTRLDDPKALDPEAEKKLPALVKFLWARKFEPDGVRLTNGRRWYTWQDLAGLRKLLDGEIKLVGRLHAAGVGLLAGTDTPSPLVVPGESLHDELELFVRAGLTPAEALRTATVNPAKCLKRDTELGTIEAGKFADLVLLSANPLEDIKNTRRIKAVWVGGRSASGL